MKITLTLLLAVTLLFSACTSFARGHSVTSGEVRELHRAEVAFSVIFLTSLTALIITAIKRRRKPR